MFTPLTISIFSGALSPSCLEGQHYVSGRLLQAIGKLKNLPDFPDGLTGRLREVLADWQVDLVLPSFDFLPSTSHFSDFDATAVLCRLRVEEMEHVMTVSYCEEESTPRYSFYKALLSAEARWLKLLLKEQMGLLCSDHAARMLLCKVLEEVYDTGVWMDDACGKGWEVELCRQLKGALASLYLELTIDFGYLLQPVDYLDYRYLLSDVHYLHAIHECEGLKYDILQTGNQVKNLLCTELTEESESVALQLYDKLAVLHAGLESSSPSAVPLSQGIVALENYLFLLLSGLPLTEKNLYEMLVDKKWTSDCLKELCRQSYSGHMQYNEGRGASHWILRKIKERCLDFLSPLVTCEASLPRQLRKYLLRQQELYEQNYSRSFIPVQFGEKLSVAPSRMFGSSQPDEGEVHALLAFLCRSEDAKGACLMTPEHVKWLEEDFICFLQSGKISMIHKNGVKILKGYAEVLYGLFFHYQQLRGGDKMDYAAFIASVLNVDVEPKNLVSNSKRYIETYAAFIKKVKLRLSS